MLPAASRVGDVEPAHQAEWVRRGPAHAQHIDGFSLAGDQHELAGDRNRGDAPTEASEQCRSRPIGEAVLVLIDEAEEAPVRGEEARAICARGEDGTIGQFGHADGVVQTGGKGGDAEVRRVQPGASNAERNRWRRGQKPGLRGVGVDEQQQGKRDRRANRTGVKRSHKRVWQP